MRSYSRALRLLLGGIELLEIFNEIITFSIIFLLIFNLVDFVFSTNRLALGNYHIEFDFKENKGIVIRYGNEDYVIVLKGIITRYNRLVLSEEHIRNFSYDCFNNSVNIDIVSEVDEVIYHLIINITLVNDSLLVDSTIYVSSESPKSIKLNIYPDTYVLCEDELEYNVIFPQLGMGTPYICIYIPPLSLGVAYLEDIYYSKILFKQGAYHIWKNTVAYKGKRDMESFCCFGFKCIAEKSIQLAESETPIHKYHILIRPNLTFDNKLEVSDFYLKSLANLYERIKKPRYEEINWDNYARKALLDLGKNECWVNLRGEMFPRAYVGDPRVASELITVLELCYAIKLYESYLGNVSWIDDHLDNLIPLFYSKGMISNSYPPGAREDSWYIVGHMAKLAKLAFMGSQNAYLTFFNSIDNLVKFARKINYTFPVFFNRYTLEPIPGGQELDVAGAYSYVMFLAYELSGNSTYLNEALKALDRLMNLPLEVFYEAHITAMSAVAAAKAYLYTGNEKYLKLSYYMIANLMWRASIWQLEDRWITFFGILPCCGIVDYIAAKELYESVLWLKEYYLLVGDKLPDYIRSLLNEFFKYSNTVAKYTLPEFLPPETIEEKPDIGVIIRNYTIPIEDLRFGFRKNGIIGQEIYGAGEPIVLATLNRIYHNDAVRLPSYGIMEFAGLQVGTLRDGEIYVVKALTNLTNKEYRVFLNLSDLKDMEYTVYDVFRKAQLKDADLARGFEVKVSNSTGILYLVTPSKMLKLRSDVKIAFQPENNTLAIKVSSNTNIGKAELKIVEVTTGFTSSIKINITAGVNEVKYKPLTRGYYLVYIKSEDGILSINLYTTGTVEEEIEQLERPNFMPLITLGALIIIPITIFLIEMIKILKRDDKP